MNRKLSMGFIRSPFGGLKIQFDSEYVYSIGWTESEMLDSRGVNQDHMEMYELINKKFELFWKGEIFDLDLPHKFLKGTDFQKKVWSVLKEIPYGSTVAYGKIAKRIGMPKAARAVGNACGKNELVLLIPCHRVIKSNGAIGNYSAPGGTALKKRLIEFERYHITRTQDQQKAPI